ncbi:uncharacterized protein LOC111405946 [Olea europaea var. sylvestris]|nr:uncharacterized protein LOC111405946 [Olea europaea var. sylvestris]
MSPSPSPVPSANSNTRDVQNPVNQPKLDICDMVSDKCHIAGYKITACVPSLGKDGSSTYASVVVGQIGKGLTLPVGTSPQDVLYCYSSVASSLKCASLFQRQNSSKLSVFIAGSGGSYMLLLNDFESSLKLNIAVRPMNEILENIEIPAHQVKEVNLPQNIVGISSISLSTGNGNCVIHVGDAGSEGFYTKYFTPISGAYLLFATGLLIAGIWACRKLGKRGRHLDGVPYRGLEMGKKDSNSSTSVGTAVHWDQSWNEDWDEEKAMKSPQGSHLGKRLRNGSTLRYIDTD